MLATAFEEEKETVPKRLSSFSSLNTDKFLMKALNGFLCDTDGILHQEFVSHGQTVNQHFHTLCSISRKMCGGSTLRSDMLGTLSLFKILSFFILLLMLSSHVVVLHCCVTFTYLSTTCFGLTQPS
jgi:hypothetical protein